MGMPDMNNQKRKKLYKTKQGQGKYVGLAARLKMGGSAIMWITYIIFF